MNLRLLQIGDSALPIGSYSHSWGLEAAIDGGLVRDAAGLEQWVRSWLRHAVGPLEGVLVAVSCRAAVRQDWAGVLSANEVAVASLAPPTLRHASGEMGEQMLALAGAWPWARGAAAGLRQAAQAPGEPPPWHHAVVFATLAAAAGAEPAEALAVYLHQAALGAISAGVRAIPIGHTHGQEVLARLHEEVQELAGGLADRELETAGSFCPAYEVLCYAQSRLYTRIFRS
jgi:urease accessory protein